MLCREASEFWFVPEDERDKRQRLAPSYLIISQIVPSRAGGLGGSGPTFASKTSFESAGIHSENDCSSSMKMLSIIS